jgi:hypothetical protein
MRAAVIAAAAFLIAAASAPGAPSARLLVNAKEWSLITSRQTLHAGAAQIQLYNAGEDAHDLRLKRVGGTHTLSIGATRPGELGELRAVLRPGRWRLWCSLPGHARKGMRATLVVRR